MRRLRQVIFWTLLLLFLALGGIIANINHPKINKVICNYASSILSTHYDKNIRVGGFSVFAAHTLTLHDVFAEGFDGDTLGKIDYLAIDADLWPLWNDSLIIKNVYICDAHVIIHEKDDAFNFSYWIPKKSESEKKPSRKPSSFVLEVDSATVQLDNVDFLLNMESNELVSHSKVGYLEVNASKTTFSPPIIRVNNLYLEHTRSTLHLNPLDLAGEINQLEVTEFLGHTKNTHYGAAQVYFDIPNFWLKTVEQDTLSINNNVCYLEAAFYQPDSIQAVIHALSTDLNKKINIERTKGSVRIGNTKADITNLSTTANNSSLDVTAQLYYFNLQNLFAFQYDSIRWENTDIRANTRFAEINKWVDIPLKPNRGFYSAEVQLRSAGDINQFSVYPLKVSINKRSNLNARGRVKNITKDNRNFCGSLKGSLYKKDGRYYLPPDTSINLPDYLKINSSVCGNENYFGVTAALNSSQGNINLILDKRKDSIYADVELADYYLGTLVGTKELNPVSTEICLNTTADMYPDNTLNFNFEVNDLSYKDYNYSDVFVNGEYEKNTWLIELNSLDSNLSLYSIDEIQIDSNAIHLETTTAIANLNLHELHLSEDTVKISTNIEGSANYRDLVQSNAQINFYDSKVQYNILTRELSQLNIAAQTNDSSSRLSINSPILDLESHANVSADSLWPHLKEYIYTEISKGEKSASKDKVDVQVLVKEVDWFLSDSIAKQFNIEVAPLTLNWDAEASKMNFDFDINKIEHKDFTVENLSFDAHQEGHKLNYGIISDHIAVLDSNIFKHVGLGGSVKKDELSLNAFANDEHNKEQFDIGIVLHEEKENLRVNLKDTFIINYFYWSSREEKTTHGLDYILSKNGSEIRFSPQGNRLTLSLDSLIIPDIVYQKTGIRGYSFGQVEYVHADTFELHTDFDYRHLTLYEDTLGEISLSTNFKSNTIDGRLKVDGPLSRLDGFATYVLDSTHSAQAELNIDYIEAKLFQSFVRGEVTDMDGLITGKLQYKQEPFEPVQANGWISMDSMHFRVKRLDAPMMIQSGRIDINNQVLRLSNLSVEDSLKNQAVFNGSLDFRNPDEIIYNLDGDIPKLLAMDKSPDEKTNFHGKVLISSKIKVRGTNLNPDVNASFKVQKGSNLTYIVDQNQVKDFTGEEDVVRFVDYSDTLQIDSTIKEDIRVNLFNLVLKSILEVDPHTRVKIVLDPITGDHVEFTGGGQIEVQTDPKSPFTMNGVYNINEGFYKMTFYEIASRSLKIEPGSYVRWNNDPLNPELNLIASYNTNASPFPLVAEDVSGTPLEGAYKESRSFKLTMYVNGYVDEPRLSFKIEYTDDINAGKQNINQKLSEINRNEEEMNRQAFSILLFNSFVSPSAQTQGSNAINPFSNLSQLLSSQLNNMSKKYIKNVDIDWNINTEERTSTSGQTYQQSDIGVTVKKQIAQDRVTLEVGSGVQYKSDGSSTSNYVGNASIEISITEDGRFRLRFYSQNDNSYLGERIIDNGVSLLYRKEYEKLSDLFKSQKTESEESDSTDTK